MTFIFIENLEIGGLYISKPMHKYNEEIGSLHTEVNLDEQELWFTEAFVSDKACDSSSHQESMFNAILLWSAGSSLGSADPCSGLCLHIQTSISDLWLTL